MNHRPVLSAEQVNEVLVIASHFKRKRKAKLLRNTAEYTRNLTRIANSYIDEWISAGVTPEIFEKISKCNFLCPSLFKLRNIPSTNTTVAGCRQVDRNVN